ncbi:hypothetical protein F4679DRAFT_116631 [Xylaria curta]|nr:hypothetical protein F4679DRAFT_116631 [Xylaria curta]
MALWGLVIRVVFLTFQVIPNAMLYQSLCRAYWNNGCIGLYSRLNNYRRVYSLGVSYGYILRWLRYNCLPAYSSRTLSLASALVQV